MRAARRSLATGGRLHPTLPDAWMEEEAGGRGVATFEVIYGENVFCVCFSHCLPRGNLKPRILILSVISSHFHRQHLVLIIKRYSHRWSIKIWLQWIKKTR